MHCGCHGDQGCGRVGLPKGQVWWTRTGGTWGTGRGWYDDVLVGSYRLMTDESLFIAIATTLGATVGELTVPCQGGEGTTRCGRGTFGHQIEGSGRGGGLG